MNRLLKTAVALLCACMLPASAYAQHTTNVTVASLQIGGIGGGSPMPYGTVCATITGAQGTAISITETGWGLVPAQTQFCGTVVSGSIPGGINVPDSAHSNLAAPFNYNFVVQQLDGSGDLIGSPVQISNVAGVTGASWALDQYAPPVTVPTPTPIVGYNATVPAHCASPSLFTTPSGNAYVCAGGVFAGPIGATAGGITQLAGDVITAYGSGTQTATLATVNSTPGACGDATHSCQITTNAKGLTTAQSAVAIAAGGGTSVYGPLQVPALYSVSYPAQAYSPFLAQADNIFGVNCQYSFSDGSPYCAAGPVYASQGEFIDDETLHCLGNPSVCSHALLSNSLAKWDGAWSSSYGYAMSINPSLTPVYFSAYDLYHHYATGDGRIMVPQALYLDCLKLGIGSSQCTAEYNAYVAHIKAAWAMVPRDSTSHLYQVVAGDEYVSGTAFQEYMRNTGLVASCNVWAAVDDADMAALATAAGDSTNAAYFNSDLALLVAGIRANLIDGSTGLLIAATINNASNDDIPTSALAVYADNSPVMAAPGILTSGQKVTIATYFDTNYSSLVNPNGYVLQTQKSGGWTTLGCVQPGGGGPYSGDGCPGFGPTQYQGGSWTFHAGWFAGALALVDRAKVNTLLSSYLNGVDPGCEFFNQGSSTCNGTSPNLESPAWAVLASVQYPPSLPFTAGIACVNQYGALVNSLCGGVTTPALENWTANAGSGSTFANTGTDNTNTATATSVTWGSTAGFSGSVAHYNGTGSYAVAANATNTNFDGGSPFTPCVWFNVVSVSGADQRLISTLDGSSGPIPGWDLEISGGNLHVQLINNVGSNILDLSGPSVTSGTTYQACFTYDGTRTGAGVKIYLNGVAGGGTFPGSFTGSIASGRPVSIGAMYVSSGTYGFFFDGTIAFTRIYTGVMTSAQIAALYAAGPQ